MILFEKVNQKIKRSITKIFNYLSKNETTILINFIESGLLECKWNLAKYDKEKILSDEDFCLCIRLYDITNITNKGSCTCIMKEVEVRKDSSEEFLRAPVLDGNLLIEIGYRKPYGDWFLLASSSLILSSRNPTILYPDDSWFYLPSRNTKRPATIHEKIYQLSKTELGNGSEEIHK
ncbi:MULTISPECIES: DUF4912 domain-containing protein [unclassified Prochlorococcus]|uniref:DUF4912 domain-containing protein n=1 Tax=unclassified Prochlorococcus TaxID=2627481 RepID=UPI000533B60C|nr:MULTISPECIES: DUF4912 domain-containing protein [unclassified Prochlorococcus]KGG15031.1 hypothetical protein EV06_0893 [Prochlorococcus sp. MIT 0602]KGG17302.1 hypothetical protein EV07_0740 [Prochlorococcus sp. MIT 0603]